MYNLLEKVVEKNRFDEKVWTAEAPFCAIRYITDARDLLEETTLEIERLLKPRKNNVHLLQGCLPLSLKYFSSFKIFSAQALRNISLGEVLLVYYGNKYGFHVWSRA